MMLILSLILVLQGLLLLTLLRLVRGSRELEHRNERARNERDEMVNFLSRFAQSIITSRNVHEWLGAVAGYLANSLNAASVRIYLRRGEELELAAQYGELPKGAAGGDYALTQANRYLEQLKLDNASLGSGFLGEVLLTQRALLREEVSGAHDRGSLNTLLAVPMVLEQEATGVICVANKRHAGEGFTADDQLLLEALASQVVLGGTLIQLNDAQDEQRRMQQELQTAQGIQQALLPQQMPNSEQFKIHAVNHSALEVSGDYYDVVVIDEDLLLIVIADASGKGVPACLQMTMCRSLIHANAARYRENLDGLMRELNRNLYRDAEANGRFITMACCLIDQRDNTVEYIRAGHTELLLRLPSGEIVTICPEGPALGLMPDELNPEYDTFNFMWTPGSSLLLYTDGLTETINADREEFGLERLIQAWKDLPTDPEQGANGILAAVSEFSGRQPLADDQTLVILTRTAPTQ
jgi:phosphoserine phosphatase RsbU/P